MSDPNGYPGLVTVNSDPPARVFSKNRFLGSTPLAKHRLAPGCHRFHFVSFDEKQEREIRIHVEPGSKTRHKVRLDSIAAKTSSEREACKELGTVFAADPASRRFLQQIYAFRKGKMLECADGPYGAVALAFARFGEIPSKEHAAELERALRKHQGELQEKEAQKFDVALRYARTFRSRQAFRDALFLLSLAACKQNLELPKGWLTIGSNQPADISVDGKPVGTAPVPKLPVSSGCHLVEAMDMSSGQRRSGVVHVRPGETATFRVGFRLER